MNIKRAYYIFKSRTHVRISHLLERVLHTLSKRGLIVEHKKNQTYLHDHGDIRTAPSITTERFSFSVSYVIRKAEFTSQYWFETKQGKRIYTVYDNHHVETRVSFRAELQSFFVHFSPRHRVWVHRNSPRVVIRDVPLICASLFEPEMVRFKYHTCDFSKCRYSLEFCIAPDNPTNLTPDEVISKSYKVLGDSLTSKVSEINKILTGVDYDGDIVSPKNMPLCDNLLCKYCGLPVFASAEDKYKYDCLKHPDLDRSEVYRVDPTKYKEVLNMNLDTLESLIRECPQD